MLNGNQIVLLSFALVCLIFFGCNPEKKLKRVIDQELASGVKKDSLFLGLEFGITMEEFFDRCRELNQQGLVREGSKNMSVEYIFNDSLDQPIAFNFYADREANGPIHKYYTSFYYYAFALNRHLYADRLLEMLPNILMDWYGGNEPFTLVKDGKKYLYKIDGNRVIELYVYDTGTVVATYFDSSKMNFQELMP
jgi:hypothetical protein